METLNPCPFCGSDDISRAARYGFPVECQCRHCKAEGPSCLTSEEAVEAWNNRKSLFSTLCSCHSLRDRILCWKQEADKAVAGEYGDNPKGETMEHWRGRRAVLYELDALHNFPVNALEHENAALKDALHSLYDIIKGIRDDPENVASIINGALKLDKPNDK